MFSVFRRSRNLAEARPCSAEEVAQLEELPAEGAVDLAAAEAAPAVDGGDGSASEERLEHFEIINDEEIDGVKVC